MSVLQAGADDRYFTHARAALGVAVGLLAVFGLVLAAVLIATPGGSVHDVDTSVRSAMAQSEVPAGVAVALVFNVLGGGWVTIPLRAVVAFMLFVAARRTDLTSWIAIVVVGEASATVTKMLVDRPRPPAELVDTASASYPSGHVTITTSLALALVFIFTHPGVRRRLWLAGAVALSLAMAWSRIYLRAHWLSDTVGALALGSATAIGLLAVVDLVRPRLPRLLSDADSRAPEVTGAE